ncbi:MAG: magnesium-protoporphyrin IX monomethyl ester anaerobic oxidative cyclase [Archangiaceae bacterium]|nr:magnesium-protoporphyrin IX monomethyl ester anaerobic oxidative cyclase [Archangiaceae bacterium]
MRILLINPPHPAIGSRIPDDHLPPLGLLSIGGPLLDAGHTVKLLDADRLDLGVGEISRRALEWRPDAVLLGHSGSTSAHPTVRALTRLLKAGAPQLHLVYGGVFPTYHWRDVLRDEPQIDVIVRGEGELTTVKLMAALESGTPLDAVRGIAFRQLGAPRATEPAAVIERLDDCRVGWELIDHADYSYWGGLRAVVVQFSRGCPHPCNYCGQRGFWTRWRSRDPRLFAKELARLHREHGVIVFNFADENPTSSRARWRELCEALIAENVPDVILVGSTRADDIVRDADLLHLYKQAGVQRWLLGMENTDEKTLALIKKNGTAQKDREAIRLLRQHGILSMATWVVGFEEETHRDYVRGIKQLLSYDPDQLQMLYVTPHRWTPFFDLARARKVIQRDQSRWDYKHQVLQTRHLKPWQVLAWAKVTELVLQARPRALRRLFFADAGLRHAQCWYTQMGRRVWPHEVWGWLFRDERVTNGPTLEEFWGESLAHEEESMVVPRARRSPLTPALLPLRGQGVAAQ